MKKNFEIRRINTDEWGDAMALSWRVFLEFESEIYSKEGTANFYDFIHDDSLHTAFLNGGYPVFGAYDSNVIKGMGALRRGPHLSLLFVDSRYQHMGIATALLQYMQNFLLTEDTELGKDVLTVNSSPYAVGFYHRFGFEDTDAVQKADGIIYTPMKFYL